MRRCAILVLSILFAQPCYAGEFCKTVIRVVNDASYGFAHIRGAELDRRSQGYDSVLSLPGTLVKHATNGTGASPPSDCSIHPLSTGRSRWRYICEFPDTISHKGAPDAETIGAHITSCLDAGGKRATSATDVQPNIILYKAVTKGVRITTLRGIVEDGYGPRYIMYIDQKGS